MDDRVIFSTRGFQRCRINSMHVRMHILFDLAAGKTPVAGIGTFLNAVDRFRQGHCRKMLAHPFRADKKVTRGTPVILKVTVKLRQ
jgi:hypothetical protein